MVKSIWFIVAVTMSVHAQDADVQRDCLSCHQTQQIPNSLIYKRYLMKYSTKTAIENAMIKYLKNPKKSESIMPSAFFLKFPMRKGLIMPETMLHQNIRSFIETFDVKKKLKIKVN